MESPEEKDEELRREIETTMKEVMDLIALRKNRIQSSKEVDVLRRNFADNEKDKSGVFHISDTHHIPTTRHTKSGLDLAEALKTRIRLGKHALELEDTLNRLTVRYVEVLERQLKRSKF